MSIFKTDFLVQIWPISVLVADVCIHFFLCKDVFIFTQTFPGLSGLSPSILSHIIRPSLCLVRLPDCEWSMWMTSAILNGSRNPKWWKEDNGQDTGPLSTQWAYILHLKVFMPLLSFLKLPDVQVTGCILYSWLSSDKKTDETNRSAVGQGKTMY